MNIKKILDEIQKDRPKTLLFPTALDAKKVTAEMHQALAEATIKKLKE